MSLLIITDPHLMVRIVRHYEQRHSGLVVKTWMVSQLPFQHFLLAQRTDTVERYSVMLQLGYRRSPEYTTERLRTPF